MEKRESFRAAVRRPRKRRRRITFSEAEKRKKVRKERKGERGGDYVPD